MDNKKHTTSEPEPMKFKSLPDGQVELTTDFAIDELVDPRFLGQIAGKSFDTLIHMGVLKRNDKTGNLGSYIATYRVVGWDDLTGAFKVKLIGNPVRR